MNQNGKGSRPRPVNGEKFRANYDAIFRKPDPKHRKAPGCDSYGPSRPEQPKRG